MTSTVIIHFLPQTDCLPSWTRFVDVPLGLSPVPLVVVIFQSILWSMLSRCTIPGAACLCKLWLPGNCSTPATRSVTDRVPALQLHLPSLPRLVVPEYVFISYVPVMTFSGGCMTWDQLNKFSVQTKHLTWFHSRVRHCFIWVVLSKPLQQSTWRFFRHPVYICAWDFFFFFSIFLIAVKYT